MSGRIRITKQRRLILEVLTRTCSHPTADEIFRLVRKRIPRISLGTVYRNLELLVNQGEIIGIQSPGGPKRYDHTTCRHYHVRCTVCGRMDDITLKPFKTLEKTMTDLSGYRITGYNLEFTGICPKCSGRRKGLKTPGGKSVSKPSGKAAKSSDRTFAALEELYQKYNRREFVHPDPLEFLYNYENPSDREIVALVASSLAYGQVCQILKSVSLVLDQMPKPKEFLLSNGPDDLRAAFKGFKHRFTSGDEMASMLGGASSAIREFGSIGDCFAGCVRPDDVTVYPAMSRFVDTIKRLAGSPCDTLLPDPSRGSACKRLNLFLRWMVRQDDVDPGGWYNLPPARLVVPLDVHMHRISLKLGLTGRRQADMRTALEVTAALAEFSPGDPVRYDFALTRLGIRSDLGPSAFYRQCGLQ
jgi:uncharacterized protein (TIGR02757 family)